MYAIVDIETTGGRLNRDRITEIAIFRFDGKKVVDQYQTLINPELPIPRNITRLTGIDDQMVADAPKFYEVAKQIVEMTDDAIFVAHNVNFDYNFLKAEFKRFGFTYQRKRLCTVRLARRVLPGHASYSLGRICKDLKIKIKARHRAAGDAEATVQLLKKIILADEEGVVDTFQKYGSREAILPPHLDKSVVDDLPDAPGVYYFHDDQGKIMYVGKAVDIRARILSHFQPNLSSRKALRMKLQIHDISYQLTGNDLVAQLLESHEIKSLKPRFNVSQKRSRNVFGIFGHEDDAGYLNLSIGRIKTDGPKPLTSFGGSRAARGY
ncbi:MAG: exonuclease domain-containing protein, partial [Bacteroidota bacterium]